MGNALIASAASLNLAANSFPFREIKLTFSPFLTAISRIPSNFSS